MLELFIFILGVCIGSFMNVLILRIPVNKSIVLPRSSCPHCKSPLKAYHLIPILSFIFLQGKCASCKHNISLQYPLIELLSGAIFIFIFFKLGLSLASLCVALCFVLLLALSVIDFYHKAVPDNLNLAALLFALFSAPLYFTFEHALLFAGGFTLLRFSLSFLLKKEAAGEGDTIAFGIIGALLGTQLGLVTIYLSAVFAIIAFLIARQKNMQLPYIPFLALALWCVYIFDTTFINLLDKLYG